MSSLASPNTKQAHPEVLALAKYLRNRPELKQRPALLGGRQLDIFRGKRAVRALLSPDYEKARIKQPKLPEIADRESALKNLARLANDMFAVNVQKLETAEALARSLKPLSGVPVVLMREQQQIGDEEYMVWLYNPTPLLTYVYGVGALLGFAAIALYQLWPVWARQASYYVSLGSMCLIGVLLTLTIVRLILFVLSLPILSRGFWLLPNLYADVGFLQSFRPLYAFSGDKTLPPKPKKKKRRADPQKTGVNVPGNPTLAANGPSPPAATNAQSPLAGPAAVQNGQVMMTPNGPMMMTPNGPMAVTPQGLLPVIPGPNGPMAVTPEIKQKLDTVMLRAKSRFQTIVQGRKTPLSPNEVKELQQKLMKEESEKMDREGK